MFQDLEKSISSSWLPSVCVYVCARVAEGVCAREGGTDRQCGSVRFVYHCSTIQLVRQVAFFFVSLLCPHSPVSPNFLSNQMQILNPFSNRCFLFCEKSHNGNHTLTAVWLFSQMLLYAVGARLTETWWPVVFLGPNCVSYQSCTSSPITCWKTKAIVWLATPNRQDILTTVKFVFLNLIVEIL